jgi:hypothetical protein
VGRRNDDMPVGGQKPVDFFHHANDVADMLNHMNDANFPERVVAKRVRKTVEIGDNIGAGASVAVKADRAWKFIDAAADVEYGQLGKCCIY